MWPFSVFRPRPIPVDENPMVCDALLQEQAYLVAHGVRPCALVGHCKTEYLEMLKVATRLERSAWPGAIAFVCNRGDGIADYGYAASRWVIDLLMWAATDTVPEKHRHHITGLLLGYSPFAIRAHEEQGAVRRFEPREKDA